MRVLIIDNFDSFTYNLFHYVNEFVECDVIRNDQIDYIDFNLYNKVILSPGPSLPKDHPKIFDFLNKYFDKKSILGICLGHQAIVEFFGGSLVNLEKVKHGVVSLNFIKKRSKIFLNLPSKFMVTHYHSWIANKLDLPECFEITSENIDGYIMSLNHKYLDIISLQFHPESVMTKEGKLIIKNWLYS
tara:strand:+ start:72264 stop:72824 length:561 start_codon:yes stop_codon:yes gene_type:complete